MESVRPAGAGDLLRVTELTVEILEQMASVRGGSEYLRLDLGAGAAHGDPLSDGPSDPEADQGNAVGAERSAAEALVSRWSTGSTDRALYIGEFETATVGFAAASVDASKHRGRIECCFVEPGARGVGVGTELMATVVAWFAEVGCLDVDATALPGDRSSKQLLESAGFKARLLVLHRRLD